MSERCLEESLVWLAEADVKRRHNRVDVLGNVQVGEVAVVLQCAADLHVTDDDVAQAEAPEAVQEFGRTCKELHDGYRGHTQRASYGGNVHIGRVQAKPADRAAEQPLRVL